MGPGIACRERLAAPAATAQLGSRLEKCGPMAVRPRASRCPGTAGSPAAHAARLTLGKRGPMASKATGIALPGRRLQPGGSRRVSRTVVCRR